MPRPGERTAEDRDYRVTVRAEGRGPVTLDLYAPSEGKARTRALMSPATTGARVVAGDATNIERLRGERVEFEVEDLDFPNILPLTNRERQFLAELIGNVERDEDAANFGMEYDEVRALERKVLDARP